jgi:peptidoglycan/LPS O-acetylase OafA/YrhL
LPTHPHRIAYLDGWRVIAIALVLLDHVDNNTRVAAFYDAHHLRFLADYGEVGVFIFFFISGYVVSLTSLKETATRGDFSAKAFYLRRLFRIAPPLFAYLLACLALGAFAVIPFSAANFISAALYLCNAAAPGVACDWHVGHTWSLAFEEQFYLLFPLVFAALELGRRPSPARAALALGAAAIPFVFTVWWIGKIGCVVTYALFFAGYLAARRRFGLLDRMSGPPRSLLLLLAALVVFMPRGVVASFGGDEAMKAELIAWYRLLHIAAIPALVLLSGRAQTPLAHGLASATMVRLGKATYSIYLWQQLLTGPLAMEWSPAAMLAALAALVAAAVLVFETLETALINKGRTLSDRIRARG